jgi:hypothetical protein
MFLSNCSTFFQNWPNFFDVLAGKQFRDLATLVDCHLLKRTGAKSAGRSTACNDFILPGCATRRGGPGMLQTGRGQRDGHHGLRGEDLGGERQCVEL